MKSYNFKYESTASCENQSRSSGNIVDIIMWNVKTAAEIIDVS